MPKYEKGSIKDIGRRIKAKGLQKLKFYCQICQKQCRDANGFKCHLTSEHHLRLMKIFSTTANEQMNKYSKEFEALFMETLRTRHGTCRVRANTVYQQVIHDRHHIHMNSTIWTSLTDFIKYLGKTGKVIVDDGIEGNNNIDVHNSNATAADGGTWHITYINHDPTMLAKREALAQRQQREINAERQLQHQMDQQRKEAAKAYELAIINSNNNDHDHTDSSDDNNHHEDGKEQKLRKVVQVDLKLPSSYYGNGYGNSDHKKKKMKNIGRTSTCASSASKFFQDDDNDEDDHDDDQKESTAAQVTTQKLTSKEQNAANTQATHDNESSTIINRSSSASNHNHEQHVDNDNKKEQEQEQDGWLYRHILVRIINKTLANGKFYHRKAVVDKVLHDSDHHNDERRHPREKRKSSKSRSQRNGSTAQVTILDTNSSSHDGGDMIQFHQDDLQTVIPQKKGKLVRILRDISTKNKKWKTQTSKDDDDDDDGHHTSHHHDPTTKTAGQKAIVIELNDKQRIATLELLSDGTHLNDVSYDDFSKLAS